MNRFTSIFGLALGLTLSFACGDDGGDGEDVGSRESISTLCQRACATAASLSCPNQDDAACRNDCEQAEAAQTCQVEARTAVECFAGRPASDWECDEDGEATLKDEVCAAEGNAALACLFGDSEDGACPFEDDGECDDPTGSDLCAAGTDLADCS